MELKYKTMHVTKKYWHSHCHQCMKYPLLNQVHDQPLRENRNDNRNESETNCIVVEGAKPILVNPCICLIFSSNYRRELKALLK